MPSSTFFYPNRNTQMITVVKLSDEEQLVYEEWLKSRPVKIQEMVKSHPPYILYQNKFFPNQRVTILSYYEDRTVRVAVLKEHNPDIIFERTVFGVQLSDLKPCE